MRKSQYSLEEKRDFARKMRSNSTEAENALWIKLQRRQVGHAFRPQVLIAGYIVDFYCGAVRLAIEVDGSVHEIEERAFDDDEKERALEERGIGLLRFSNEDVLNYIGVVLARIQSECAARATLTAFDVGGRFTKYSSRNRQKENFRTRKTNHKTINQLNAESGRDNHHKSCGDTLSPSENEQFLTPVELNRKIAILNRQRSMNFEAYVDTRPTAEKVWEQQFKLQEWMKKRNASAELLRTEPETLTLKGMVVQK
jgi:very-short-patch-repair endonuclease